MYRVIIIPPVTNEPVYLPQKCSKQVFFFFFRVFITVSTRSEADAFIRPEQIFYEENCGREQEPKFDMKVSHWFDSSDVILFYCW